MQNQTLMLVEAIRLAQFAPGQSYSFTKVAAFLRMPIPDLINLLQDLAPRGLYSIQGTDVVIAPIDSNALQQQLPIIAALEEKIARAAAKNIKEEHKIAMRKSMNLLRRSTLLGDILGNINADFLLEQIIGKASNLPDNVKKLTELNQEFKRSWCAANRLSDMSSFANQREQLLDCIIAQDADGAAEVVRLFFEDVKNRI